MKFVKILWRDAADYEKTWTSLEEVTVFCQTDLIIVSYGYLVYATGDYLALASDWEAEKGSFGRVAKIPRACILDIHEIKEVEHAKRMESVGVAVR